MFGEVGSNRLSLFSDDQRIKVVCRIRPTDSRASAMEEGSRKCLIQQNRTTLALDSKFDQKIFNLDYIANEDIPQEEMFRVVGLPYAQACLEGYNGTILCYGQTGSGKTFTMFGPSSAECAATADKGYINVKRGLVPRVLEYLWSRISRQDRQSDSGGEVFYVCRCSFFEIYQDKVYDLLDAAGVVGSTFLQIREDAKLGVYVEGITEEAVNSSEDAARVLALGYRNRHVGETAMNLESSRSHAVFQLILVVTEEQEGLKTSRTSRFSLVDLAGSERQKEANTSGERLKEAGQINKSLLVLGNVINALADKLTSGRRFVNYRDSKLTFLLRDSLGGNSKTVLVATVSPSECNAGETLSTLKFAQRAKVVRTAAVVNEETSGTLLALQKEVLALRTRLAAAELNGSYHLFSSVIPIQPVPDPAVAEEDKDRVLVPNVVGLDAQFNILAEATERCRIVDDMRADVTLQLESANLRLEQEEKLVLALKDKLHSMESEKRRSKGESSENDEGILGNVVVVGSGVGSGGSGGGSEEALHKEMNIQIQELKSELLRYKRRCEELESHSMKSRPQSPLPLPWTWDDSKERKFQHNLCERVILTENAQQELQRKLEVIASDRFLEDFGFSLEEARSLASRYSEAQTKADDAEAKLKTMKELVGREQSRVLEAEKVMEALKRGFEQQLSQQSMAMQELESKVDFLQMECVNKNDELESVYDKINAMEGELRSINERAEDLRREDHSKWMEKHSALMFKNHELACTLQDTQGIILEKESLIMAGEMKISELQAHLLRQQKTAEEQEGRILELDIRITKAIIEEKTRLQSDFEAKREKLIQDKNELLGKNRLLEVQQEELTQQWHMLDISVTDLTGRLQGAEETVTDMTTQLQLSNASVTDLTQRLQLSEQSVTELTAKLQLTEESVTDSKLKLQSTDVVVTDLTQRLQLSEHSVTELTTKLQLSDSLITDLTQRLQLSEQSVTDLTQQLQLSETSVAELTSKVQLTEQSVTDSTQKLNSSDLLVTDLTQRLQLSEESSTVLATKFQLSEQSIIEFTQQLQSSDLVVTDLTKRLQFSESSVTDLTKRLQFSESSVTEMTKRLQLSESSVIEFTQRSQDRSLQLDAAERSVADLNTVVQEWRDRSTELEDKLAVTTVSLEEMSVQKDALESQLKQFELSVSDLKDKLVVTTVLLEEMSVHKDALESQLKQFELSVSDLKDKLVVTTVSLEEMSVQKDALESQRDVLLGEKDTLLLRILELENTVTVHLDAISDLDSKLGQTEGQLGVAESSVTYLNGVVRDMHQKNGELESELNRSNIELQDVCALKLALENERDILLGEKDTLLLRISELENTVTEYHDTIRDRTENQMSLEGKYYELENKKTEEIKTLKQLLEQQSQLKIQDSKKYSDIIVELEERICRCNMEICDKEECLYTAETALSAGV
eukprot:gene6961-14137_t